VKTSPGRQAVESQGMQANYMALSYCWGVTQHFKTIAGNLEAMKGRLIETACLDFLRCNIVARRLNIRFFGSTPFVLSRIDPDDWARESAQMSKIYGNVILTVCRFLVRF